MKSAVEQSQEAVEYFMGKVSDQFPKVKNSLESNE